MLIKNIILYICINIKINIMTKTKDIIRRRIAFINTSSASESDQTNFINDLTSEFIQHLGKTIYVNDHTTFELTNMAQLLTKVANLDDCIYTLEKTFRGDYIATIKYMKRYLNDVVFITIKD